LVDDKTAEEFATYMKKFSDLYAYLSKIVKNHTGMSRPRILDLGTGPGLLSVEILKQIPDATIIGVDPSKKMLLLAKENIGQSDGHIFESVLGVSEKIPLKDKSIDTIVSRFSLPYWKQPHDSFLEMHRVLKPRGKIVLESLNRDFPKWKLFCIKISMLFNRAGRDVTRYHVDAYDLAHSQEEVEMFFKKSGFDILEEKGKKNEWKFIIVAEKK
jgi:demethylmenaquinone methyltransferase/2-methoxy-6-polyprenyl-1,4-benzoquinol methylase